MGDNPPPHCSMKPIFIESSQAPVIRAYGDELHVHLDGTQTGGAFTMVTDITPPGGGPPPHFHRHEDEWFYVLEGQAGFFDGETWTEVRPGGAVFMPKHSLHTFQNAGDTPLKQIVHTTPSGMETFFRKSAAEFQDGKAPDMPRILEIGAEHGIHFPTIAPESMAQRGQPALPPAIVQHHQGRILHAFGEEVTVLLDGTQTGGAVTLFVETTPPGGGPPPHFHEREDEWFHVLEGCVSFYTGGQWTDAHPGDVVFVPRQSVHTFRNNTGHPVRMLIHTAPSGFETFFAEAAEEFAQPGGPDMDRCMAIAASHGIHFVQG